MAECIVGIDLGGTNASGAIATLAGEILDIKVVPTPKQGGKAVLEAVYSLVKKLSNSYDLKALALAIPGLHDLEKGICISSGNLNWHYIEVVPYFKEKLGDIPILFDNDVNVAARGELRYGAAKNCRDFIYVTVGTGIGGGIYIDGKLLQGPRWCASEVGHMVMLPQGLSCSCGGQGCLETLAAAPAIAREGRVEALKQPSSILHKLAAENGGQITAKMVSLAYDKGDEAARLAFERSIGWLGIGMAGLVNIFNPSLLVIGGGVSLAGDSLLRIVREKIDKHSMEVQKEHVIVTTSALKDKAGMYGAIAYALDRISLHS